MTQAPLELPTVRFGRDTTGFAKASASGSAHFKEKGIHKKADTRMKTKTVIMLGTYFEVSPSSPGATGGKLDVLGCANSDGPGARRNRHGRDARR